MTGAVPNATASCSLPGPRAFSATRRGPNAAPLRLAVVAPPPGAAAAVVVHEEVVVVERVVVAFPSANNVHGGGRVCGKDGNGGANEKSTKIGVMCAPRMYRYRKRNM